jgi:probable F420-dependent oxidoreductase
MTKKFRFGVQTSGAKSGEAWREKARKIEDLGYSTLLIPDHFDDQYAPMPAMAVAAEATSTLRVSGLVLDNDYKHPLVLAKEIATLDVLSGGRVDLGLGAGWMETDYVASGIPYDAPGVRISRFHEGLRIIKGLLSDEPVDFKGTYYTITNHNGTPRPVQKPVPVLIGGGGKRVLRIAAREADIISVNFNLAPGKVNQSVMKTGDATSTEEKIGWIRDAAGAHIDELELSVTVFVAIVSDDQAGIVGRISAGFGMTPEETLASPHALVGSVDQIADALMERRERFGFSYVVFSGDGYAALAPVVKKLAGN